MLIAVTKGLAKGSMGHLPQLLIQMLFLVIALKFLPAWIMAWSDFWGQRVVIDYMAADPAGTFDKAWQAANDSFTEGNIFDVPMTVLVTIMIVLAILFATVLYFLAHLVTFFLTWAAIAVAPIFLGLLMTPVSDKAKGFLLALFGMTLWPLGWGLSSLMTDALLPAAFDTGTSPVQVEAFFSNAFVDVKRLLYALVASVWIVISTVFGPIIIQRLLSGGLTAALDLADTSGAAMGGAKSSGGKMGAMAKGAVIGAILGSRIGGGRSGAGQNSATSSNGSGSGSVTNSAVTGQAARAGSGGQMIGSKSSNNTSTRGGGSVSSEFNEASQDMSVGGSSNQASEVTSTGVSPGLSGQGAVVAKQENVASRAVVNPQGKGVPKVARELVKTTKSLPQATTSAAESAVRASSGVGVAVGAGATALALDGIVRTTAKALAGKGNERGGYDSSVAEEEQFKLESIESANGGGSKKFANPPVALASGGGSSPVLSKPEFYRAVASDSGISLSGMPTPGGFAEFLRQLNPNADDAGRSKALTELLSGRRAVKASELGIGEDEGSIADAWRELSKEPGRYTFYRDADDQWTFRSRRPLHGQARTDVWTSFVSAQENSKWASTLDLNTVERVRKPGTSVALEDLSKNLRQPAQVAALIATLTEQDDREYAVYEDAKDGKWKLISGHDNSVEIPRGTIPLMHSHPSGDLRMSFGDFTTVMSEGRSQQIGLVGRGGRYQWSSIHDYGRLAARNGSKETKEKIAERASYLQRYTSLDRRHEEDRPVYAELFENHVQGDTEREANFIVAANAGTERTYLAGLVQADANRSYLPTELNSDHEGFVDRHLVAPEKSQPDGWGGKGYSEGLTVPQRVQEMVAKVGEAPAATDQESAQKTLVDAFSSAFHRDDLQVHLSGLEDDDWQETDEGIAAQLPQGELVEARKDGGIRIYDRSGQQLDKPGASFSDTDEEDNSPAEDGVPKFSPTQESPAPFPQSLVEPGKAADASPDQMAENAPQVMKSATISSGSSGGPQVSADPAVRERIAQLLQGGLSPGEMSALKAELLNHPEAGEILAALEMMANQTGGSIGEGTNLTPVVAPVDASTGMSDTDGGDKNTDSGLGKTRGRSGLVASLNMDEDNEFFEVVRQPNMVTFMAKSETEGGAAAEYNRFYNRETNTLWLNSAKRNDAPKLLTPENHLDGEKPFLEGGTPLGLYATARAHSELDPKGDMRTVGVAGVDQADAVFDLDRIMKRDGITPQQLSDDPQLAAKVGEELWSSRGFRHVRTFIEESGYEAESPRLLVTRESLVRAEILGTPAQMQEHDIKSGTKVLNAFDFLVDVQRPDQAVAGGAEINEPPPKATGSQEFDGPKNSLKPPPKDPDSFSDTDDEGSVSLPAGFGKERQRLFDDWAQAHEEGDFQRAEGVRKQLLEGLDDRERWNVERSVRKLVRSQPATAAIGAVPMSLNQYDVEEGSYARTEQPVAEVLASVITKRSVAEKSLVALVEQDGASVEEQRGELAATVRQSDQELQGIANTLRRQLPNSSDAELKAAVAGSLKSTGAVSLSETEVAEIDLMAERMFSGPDPRVFGNQKIEWQKFDESGNTEAKQDNLDWALHHVHGEIARSVATLKHPAFADEESQKIFKESVRRGQVELQTIGDSVRKENPELTEEDLRKGLAGALQISQPLDKGVELDAVNRSVDLALGTPRAPISGDDRRTTSGIEDPPKDDPDQFSDTEKGEGNAEAPKLAELATLELPLNKFDPAEGSYTRKKSEAAFLLDHIHQERVRVGAQLESLDKTGGAFEHYREDLEVEASRKDRELKAAANTLRRSFPEHSDEELKNAMVGAIESRHPNASDEQRQLIRGTAAQAFNTPDPRPLGEERVAWSKVDSTGVKHHEEKSLGFSLHHVHQELSNAKQVLDDPAVAGNPELTSMFEKSLGKSRDQLQSIGDAFRENHPDMSDEELRGALVGTLQLTMPLDRDLDLDAFEETARIAVPEKPAQTLPTPETAEEQGTTLSPETPKSLQPPETQTTETKRAKDERDKKTESADGTSIPPVSSVTNELKGAGGEDQTGKSGVVDSSSADTTPAEHPPIAQLADRLQQLSGGGFSRGEISLLREELMNHPEGAELLALLDAMEDENSGKGGGTELPKPPIDDSGFSDSPNKTPETLEQRVSRWADRQSSLPKELSEQESLDLLKSVPSEEREALVNKMSAALTQRLPENPSLPDPPDDGEEGIRYNDDEKWEPSEAQLGFANRMVAALRNGDNKEAKQIREALEDSVSSEHHGQLNEYLESLTSSTTTATQSNPPVVQPKPETKSVSGTERSSKESQSRSKVSPSVTPAETTNDKRTLPKESILGTAVPFVRQDTKDGRVETKPASPGIHFGLLLDRERALGVTLDKVQKRQGGIWNDYQSIKADEMAGVEREWAAGVSTLRASYPDLSDSKLLAECMKSVVHEQGHAVHVADLPEIKKRLERAFASPDPRKLNSTPVEWRRLGESRPVLGTLAVLATIHRRLVKAREGVASVANRTEVGLKREREREVARAEHELRSFGEAVRKALGHLGDDELQALLTSSVQIQTADKEKPDIKGIEDSVRIALDGGGKDAKSPLSSTPDDGPDGMSDHGDKGPEVPEHRKVAFEQIREVYRKCLRGEADEKDYLDASAALVAGLDENSEEFRVLQELAVEDISTANREFEAARKDDDPIGFQIHPEGMAGKELITDQERRDDMSLRTEVTGEFFEIRGREQTKADEKEAEKVFDQASNGDWFFDGQGQTANVQALKTHQRMSHKDLPDLLNAVNFDHSGGPEIDKRRVLLAGIYWEQMFHVSADLNERNRSVGNDLSVRKSLAYLTEGYIDAGKDMGRATKSAERDFALIEEGMYELGIFGDGGLDPRKRESSRGIFGRIRSALGLSNQPSNDRFSGFGIGGKRGSKGGLLGDGQASEDEDKSLLPPAPTDEGGLKDVEDSEDSGNPREHRLVSTPKGRATLKARLNELAGGGKSPEELEELAEELLERPDAMEILKQIDDQKSAQDGGALASVPGLDSSLRSRLESLDSLGAQELALLKAEVLAMHPELAHLFEALESPERKASLLLRHFDPRKVSLEKVEPPRPDVRAFESIDLGVTHPVVIDPMFPVGDTVVLGLLAAEDGGIDGKVVIQRSDDRLAFIEAYLEDAPRRTEPTNLPDGQLPLLDAKGSPTILDAYMRAAKHLGIEPGSLEQMEMRSIVNLTARATLAKLIHRSGHTAEQLVPLGEMNSALAMELALSKGWRRFSSFASWTGHEMGDAAVIFGECEPAGVAFSPQALAILGLSPDAAVPTDFDVVFKLKPAAGQAAQSSKAGPPASDIWDRVVGGAAEKRPDLFTQGRTSLLKLYANACWVVNNEASDEFKRYLLEDLEEPDRKSLLSSLRAIERAAIASEAQPFPDTELPGEELMWSPPVDSGGFSDVAPVDVGKCFGDQYVEPFSAWKKAYGSWVGGSMNREQVTQLRGKLLEELSKERAQVMEEFFAAEIATAGRRPDVVAITGLFEGLKSDIRVKGFQHDVDQSLESTKQITTLVDGDIGDRVGYYRNSYEEKTKIFSLDDWESNTAPAWLAVSDHPSGVPPLDPMLGTPTHILASLLQIKMTGADRKGIETFQINAIINEPAVLALSKTLADRGLSVEDLQEDAELANRVGSDFLEGSGRRIGMLRSISTIVSQSGHEVYRVCLTGIESQKKDVDQDDEISAEKLASWGLDAKSQIVDGFDLQLDVRKALPDTTEFAQAEDPKAFANALRSQRPYMSNAELKGAVTEQLLAKGVDSREATRLVDEAFGKIDPKVLSQAPIGWESHYEGFDETREGTFIDAALDVYRRLSELETAEKEYNSLPPEYRDNSDFDESDMRERSRLIQENLRLLGETARAAIPGSDLEELRQIVTSSLQTGGGDEPGLPAVSANKLARRIVDAEDDAKDWLDQTAPLLPLGPDEDMDGLFSDADSRGHRREDARPEHSRESLSFGEATPTLPNSSEVKDGGLWFGPVDPKEGGNEGDGESSNSSGGPKSDDSSKNTKDAPPFSGGGGSSVAGGGPTWPPKEWDDFVSRNPWAAGIEVFPLYRTFQKELPPVSLVDLKMDRLTDEQQATMLGSLLRIDPREFAILEGSDGRCYMVSGEKDDLDTRGMFARIHTHPDSEDGTPGDLRLSVSDVTHALAFGKDSMIVANSVGLREISLKDYVAEKHWEYEARFVSDPQARAEAQDGAKKVLLEQILKKGVIFKEASFTDALAVERINEVSTLASLALRNLDTEKVVDILFQADSGNGLPALLRVMNDNPNGIDDADWNVIQEYLKNDLGVRPPNVGESRHRYLESIASELLEQTSGAPSPRLIMLSNQVARDALVAKQGGFHEFDVFDRDGGTSKVTRSLMASFEALHEARLFHGNSQNIPKGFEKQAESRVQRITAELESLGDSLRKDDDLTQAVVASAESNEELETLFIMLRRS